MKKIVVFSMFLFLMVFFLQGTEKVSRLGVHPFHKSHNLTVDELRKISQDRVGEVKIGFELAGYGELVYAFLEQIEKADIVTDELKPGDTLKWMMFKEKKTIKIKTDVEWVAKAATPIYKFKVTRDNKIYNFVVPKVCANISLRSIENAPPPPPPPVVKTEQKEVVANKEVQPLKEEDPFAKKQKPVEKGNQGFFLADIGPSWMKDPTTFLFVRAGYGFKLSDDFRVLGLAGYFFNLQNNYYGNAGAIDVEFCYWPSVFFIGTGVGYWIDGTYSDSKLDWVVNLGYQLFGNQDLAFYIMSELRIAFKDMSNGNVSGMSRLGVGLRVVFQ